MNIVWIILLSLLQYSNESAVTYYVSENGNDKNDGKTVQSAFRTLGTAVKRMKAGDECLVMQGTYRETVIVETDHITLRAYEGHRVVITGLDPVGTLKRFRGNIFQANFKPQEKDSTSAAWHLHGKGKYFTQVFADGAPVTQARFPNATGHLLQWQHHGAPVTIYPGGKFSFHGAQPAGSWQGAVFHAIVEKKYNAVQGVVSASDGKAFTCGNATEGWKKSTNGNFRDYLFTKSEDTPTGIGRGFITNHLNAVDAPGEWHWDKKTNTLYIVPPAGKDPASMAVEAMSRKLGLVIRRCTGVVIDGISFHATGVELQQATQCTVTRCHISYPLPFYVHQEEYNGKAAVSMEGNSNTIQHTTITHSWGSGVEIISGEGNVFENNLVSDVNWMGTYNACVRAGGAGTRIEHNTLHTSGRFIIQGTGIKQGKIRYNDMHSAMLIGQDGGAFYTYVQDGADTEIAFNWVHDIEGVPWERSPHKDHNVSVGIYLDGGCQRFNVHHNYIWNTVYGIMFNATPGAPGKAEKMSRGNKMNHNTCLVTGTSAIVSKNLPALYENNEASFNLTNKRVSGLAEKQGNQVESALTPPRRERAQRNTTGAYDSSISTWTPGADTTKFR